MPIHMSESELRAMGFWDRLVELNPDVPVTPVVTIDRRPKPAKKAAQARRDRETLDVERVEAVGGYEIRPHPDAPGSYYIFAPSLGSQVGGGIFTDKKIAILHTRNWSLAGGADPVIRYRKEVKT